MLRATCVMEENVVILLFISHSLPHWDGTSVSPCTLQTLWIIDVIWDWIYATSAPHINDTHLARKVLMQKSSVWGTSPHKALNLRHPGFGFISCCLVIILWLITNGRPRGCPLRSAFICLRPIFCPTAPFLQLTQDGDIEIGRSLQV